MTSIDPVCRLRDGMGSLDEFFGLSASSLPHAGLALVIVDAQGGQEILTHGVADLRSADSVDADTMFNIGSCSKAFAATLVQLLAADGLIELDAPIVRYAPQFSVSDPWITERATVHDALVHRVGVASRFFLRLVATSRADFVGRLRHAPETSGFRYRFKYNNSLYMVLAHLAEQVTGQDWDALLRERLLGPLAMARTAADVPEGEANLALPHMLDRSGESLRPISLDYLRAMRGLSSPSGGVFMSATDLASWLRFHLRTSRGLDTPGLPSAEHLDCMYDERIVVDQLVRPHSELARLRGSIGHGYAYGWSTGQYRSHRMIYHGGATPGYRAAAAVLPDANLAVGILTNSDSLNHAALAFEVVERALGARRGLWSGDFRNTLPPAPAASFQPVPVDPSDYVGTFESRTLHGALVIRAEGADHLAAQLGFMDMALDPVSKDRFCARVTNDWDGPLGPIGPLAVQFERGGGAVVRAWLVAQKGIDNEEEELEFVRG